MQRVMLRSKIHRARVTDSNVDYEGSIAIDTRLMEAAGIIPFQKVEVYNVTNGNRFGTYAIEGEEGSGTISVNGAAAHLARAGDIIIIADYCVFHEEEARRHVPVLVYVNEKNEVRKVIGGVVAGA
ncbi:MAG: aspartate 1-decarboxylase [Thermodesulfobacteriota bacterium]